MRTNKIIYDFNEAQFFDRFSVFCLSGDKDMWKNPVMDLLKKCTGAASVAFDNSKNCYVLVDRELEEDFQEQAVECSQNCSVELIFEIEPRFAVQLLLNSLSVDEPEKIWNMTGRCCIPHMEKKTSLSFPVIDIHIDTEDRIQLNVRTFSDYKTLHDYYRNSKDKEEQKRATKIVTSPRYNKTMFGLERAEKGKYVNVHDIKALDEKKSNITFFSVKEPDYDRTKLFDLYDVLTKLKKKYSDIIRISFQELPEANVIKRGSKDQAEEASLLSSVLMEKPVNLINKTEDKGSFQKLYECLSEQTKNMIEKEPKSKPKNRAKEVHHLPIICSENIKPNALNLCLIHDKDFYRKKEDAHTVDSEIPLQHITVETVRNCSNAQLLLPAAAKCIYDLIIKDDIQKKHISLFDWKKLGFIVPVEFWMKVFEDKEKKIRKYGSVIIDSKGSIQFSLTGNEAEPAVQILQMDKSYKTVIKKGKDYNVIQDTTLFTIPNLEEIYHQMETVPPKKSISRSRENIENVLPDIVDIRTWMEKGCLYYIVGNNSYGMDGKFLRATPVRKVIARPGSELFFQELLPTLAMPFVRNKRYTVYPFPLKYIREYAVYCRVRDKKEK